MDIDGNTEEADDAFVVQYEVRLTKGLECGGAYLKLLDAEQLPEGGNVVRIAPFGGDSTKLPSHLRPLHDRRCLNPVHCLVVSKDPRLAVHHHVWPGQMR